MSKSPHGRGAGPVPEETATAKGTISRLRAEHWKSSRVSAAAQAGMPVLLKRTLARVRRASAIVVWRYAGGSESRPYWTKERERVVGIGRRAMISGLLRDGAQPVRLLANPSDGTLDVALKSPPRNCAGRRGTSKAQQNEAQQEADEQNREQERRMIGGE